MPEELMTFECVDCGREDQVPPDEKGNWPFVHPEPCASCNGERHVRPVPPSLDQEVDEHAIVSFAGNRFFNRKTGVVHSESNVNELVDVKPFHGPVATVKRGYGLTVNLGDYESARFDVGITVPCYMVDVDAADQWAEKWAEKRIAKEVQQIRGTKDKKPPKGPAF